jgi:hypothetical protein
MRSVLDPPIDFSRGGRNCGGFTDDSGRAAQAVFSVRSAIIA